MIIINIPDETLMRRISRCLNAKLTDICQQSIKLEELSLKVNQHLPISLQKQCHVGSFNKGCLVLITNNSGWASQLRYALPELRDSLRAAGIYQLVSIKITVATENRSPIQKKTIGQAISSKARESIATHAEQCLYPPLRQALYRLAINHANTSAEAKENMED